MKGLLFLLILSVQAFASVDEYSSLPLGEKLPRKTFDKVIKIFETNFSPVSQANGREFEILTDYEAEWAQAFARRWETDQIIVYGGIAAIGTEDTFALVLCHEAGHLFAGRPYSDEHNRLSLEGQADYWGAGECFGKILPFLSPINASFEARAKAAMLKLTAHFADNRGLPHPDFSTPDETEAPTMNLTHPSPQCRLDTMIAGFKKLPRPRCWYKEF